MKYDIENEKSKYKKAWGLPEYRIFSPEGRIIHDIISWLKRKPIKTVLSVGCGEGFGMHWLEREGFEIFGNDIINVLKFPEYAGERFILGPVWDLPPFMEADAVLAIDILEHLPEDKIQDTLRALRRISTFFYFNISCRPDKFGSQIGEKLHLTVKPPSWWYERIAGEFKIEGFAGNTYEFKIMGRR